MSVIVPKEAKEALAYLKSIDISLGRIAKALEDQTYEDEEEDGLDFKGKENIYVSTEK